MIPIQTHVAIFIIIWVLLIFINYINYEEPLSLDYIYTPLRQSIVIFWVGESIGWAIYWGFAIQFKGSLI